MSATRKTPSRKRSSRFRKDQRFTLRLTKPDRLELKKAARRMTEATGRVVEPGALLRDWGMREVRGYNAKFEAPPLELATTA